MDIGSAAAAMHSLKAAKEIFTALLDLKIDGEARAKVIDAQSKILDAQTSLFEVSEKLHEVQAERDTLKRELESASDWKAKSTSYALFTAPGGAVVYQHLGEPAHYACPSCFNKKEVHILQTNRNYSGTYKCTGCSAQYPVEPVKSMASSTVRPTEQGSWMRR